MEKEQTKIANEIDRPSVYVGTYAKYNSGNLKGAWVDLTKFSNKKEFMHFCFDLHKDEKDPELMYQGYENFPAPFYSEHGISDQLWDWLDLDDRDKEIIEAFLDCFGGHIKQALDNYEDMYMGKYDSFIEFCEMTFDETAEVPPHLQNYIDYDAVERDFDTNYFYHNGHVFNRNL